MTGTPPPDLVPGRAASYALSEGSSVTLDLIRMVSAQIVVVGHLSRGLGVLPALQPPNVPYMQNVAVVVFFILSGFLISNVVITRLARPDYSFRVYFIDRFARIYTGLLPAVAFVLVLDAIQIAVAPDLYAHRDAYDARTVAGNLLMLQDFPLADEVDRLISGVEGASLLAVTSLGSGRTFWTLAIEWWIYLAFGWMLLQGELRRHRPLVYWGLLVLLAPVPVYNLVSGRGDGLTAVWLIGMLVFLALWRQVVPRLSKWSAAGVAVVFAALAGARGLITTDAYDLLFASLLAAALCFLLISTDQGLVRYGARTQRVIRVMAAYSFTLFLTHLSVYELVTRWLAAARVDYAPSVMAVIIFAVANVAALALASVTEMKHRSVARWLKERTGGRRTPDAHAAQA